MGCRRCEHPANYPWTVEVYCCIYTQVAKGAFCKLVPVSGRIARCGRTSCRRSQDQTGGGETNGAIAISILLGKLIAGRPEGVPDAAANPTGSIPKGGIAKAKAPALGCRG